MMICTVILHYNDASMTRRYIENLKDLSWGEYKCHIIVVDNASPDNSGKELYGQYEDDDLVDVVLLPENEGFARGNSAGIRLAVEKYGAQLVIVSNNDILIYDKELPGKIISEYETSGFDVLGPDIYSTYRKAHQSPIASRYPDVNELKHKVADIDRKLKRLRIINKVGIYELLRGVGRIIKPSCPDVEGWNRRQEDVVIQGAFFVLSKGYLDLYPDGLYSGTFLYMEECILNYRAVKKGLKVIYEPSIQVEHLEGLSTLKQTGNRCRKYIFALEQTKASCEEMIRYLEHGV